MNKGQALFLVYWRFIPILLFALTLSAALFMLYDSYRETLHSSDSVFDYRVSKTVNVPINPRDVYLSIDDINAYSSNTVWFQTELILWSRLVVQNRTKQQQLIHVLVDDPTLQEIDFWVADSEGHIVALDSLGSARRLLATSDYSLPHISILIPPLAKRSITIRAQSNLGSAIRINVFDDYQMNEYKETALMLWGAFLGVSLIMIMYFLAFYRVTKELIFLAYTGFTLFALLSLAVFYGFGFHIWPSQVQSFLLSHMGAVFLLALLSTVYFIRNFIIQPGKVLQDWLFVRLIALSLLFLSVVLPSHWVMLFVFAMEPILFLYVLGIAYLYMQRLSWMRYYLLSWMPIFIGLPISTLDYLGVISPTMLTKNAFLLSIIAQLSMAALSFAERMKLTEQKRIYQTTHDNYTQLPNRSAMNYALQKATDAGEPFSVVLLEIGNFLRFLPYVGSKRASNLVLEVSMLIREHQFTNIQIYSLPSFSHYISPFQVRDHVLAMLVKSQDIEAFMRDLFCLCDQDILIAGIDIGVKPVVSAVEYPEHSKSADDLLQKAMQALDYAKKEGLQFSMYCENKVQHSEIEVVIATDLRKAIQSGQLQLFHQPQVNLHDFSIYGSEVLLRWEHPTLGFLPPDVFVPVAEDIGVISELTKWVVEQAFIQQKQILQQGYNHHLSINISGKDVSDADFFYLVKSLLIKYGIKPESVTLELTESATVGDIEKLRQLMKLFQELGLQFSIDDFGTGFSSLEVLSRLSFDELKIDRGFVKDMLVYERNHIISTTTIVLANRLSMNSVAEGVENEKVVLMLKAAKCDIAQGYYFSKPRPLEDYLGWVKKMSAP